MKRWVRRQKDLQQSPAAAGVPGRGIEAGGDISGIASTGDDTVNIQNRAEQMTVLPEAFLLLRIGCDGWKGDRGSGCRSRPPFTACTGSKRASADGRKSGRAEAKVIKSRGANGKASVTFTVDPRVGAQTAAVCGGVERLVGRRRRYAP
jgi:hypothetical protein